MDAERLLALARAAGRLKRVPRAGWVRAGVPGPESVADHSYRLALLALAIAPDLGLDAGRAAAIALVHDLAESELGDRYVDPSLPGAEARQRSKGDEEAAVLERLAGSPGWNELFADYRSGSTPEGRLVRELDKLEMALTALDYEGEGARGLDEFWDSAAAGVRAGPVADLLAAARRRRPRGRESGMLQQAAAGIHYWQWFSQDKGYHFNGWIVETQGGLHVVDPALGPPSLLDDVAALGRPVEILLTNKSHVRGTSSWVERFGCPVACHAEEERLVEYPIARTFREGDVIGGEMKVLHVPGRTPGEVAFHLARDGGVLIVGDALIGKPPGQLGLLPDDKLMDPALLRQSIKKFAALPFDRLLLGDGEPILAGAKMVLVKFLSALG